ncbi:MAG: C1 family peptidase, partial [Chitinophagales bacterium]
QGLSNNSGSGATLTLTISGKKYTFGGDSYENLYPYPSNGSNTSTQYRTAPSASAISNATNFKIGVQNGTTGSSGTTTDGYYVINSSDPVTDAKTAIAYNKPVMMGFNVYDNSKYQYFEGLGIQGYAPNNYTYNPLTSSGSLVSGLTLLGGHAVPLIGYIDDASQPGGGVFICENSWSTSWGYKGYFYLPYSVLRSKTIVASGSLYVAII